MSLQYESYFYVYLIETHVKFKLCQVEYTLSIEQVQHGCIETHDKSTGREHQNVDCIQQQIAPFTSWLQEKPGRTEMKMLKT